jgi:plastocyanin
VAPRICPDHILRRAVVPCAIAAAMFVVGGCGADGATREGTHRAAGTRAPAAAGGVVLKVTGTEYSFAPSPLTASAGPTTIRFTNRGATGHDFTIRALGIHLSAQPGKSAAATATLKPGTYLVYCSVPGHRQSGMQGKLTVS